MNFISGMEGTNVQVELKYCERCGGLWLRRRGADEVFCVSCRARFAAMPDPGEAPVGTARRRRASTEASDVEEEGLSMPTRIDRLQGVAMMEVRA